MSEPRAGEIRVRVVGSAMNRADILQRRGGYPPPAGVPEDIPGLEFVGEVDAVGVGAGLWDIGSRVMGIVPGGAHAEYLCLHEREALRVPHRLNWTEAAAIPEAFLTAFDALWRKEPFPANPTILVHAIGSGVGTAALQLAKQARARVVGTSRSPEKLIRAVELGLDIPVDTRGENWERDIATQVGEPGIDVTLDLVGGPFHATNLRLAAPGGLIVVIGTVGGSRVETDLSLILRKRLRLIGTVMRTRTTHERVALAREFSDTVLPLFAAGEIKPVIDSVLPFDRVAEAHRLMEANSSFGKIVLLW